jgi:hypothetical protein
MEHAEYVYTTGMDETELDDHLRTAGHGVLALAAGDEAYAVPLNYHYDGSRLLLRVSGHDDRSEKRRFLDATATATLVCYAVSPGESWSIHVRGPVEQYSADVDEETINEWFPPFHLFDEDVAAVEFDLYELGMDAVVGRKTVG